ncbi:hypothetical protein CEY16_07925 [Halalkalibacillus sediminis]|uniref:Zinc-ribbon domain-containing protein n=1 Tax=Halalkalibacillus sediminis TaxID=2018042 RepID=A0A2I0QU60_9BACI|nr:DUF2628 domain-containing protein [Halalkalibacillus sediminis]PKR77848.1 hypothetical protein CEY16_07925 [Halalkalibacillus sediminis]
MYCNKCGEKQFEGATFCHSCGSRLPDGETNTQRNYADDQRVEESSKYEPWELFTQKRSDYYIDKWFKKGVAENKTSWNWPAFFLGIFWLGYRKMYEMIFAILGIWLALDFFAYATGIYTTGFDYLVAIISYVLFGIYGNYFYYMRAEKKLEAAKDLDGSYNRQQLKTSGGTSGLGVLAALSLLVVYAVISTALYDWILLM